MKKFIWLLIIPFLTCCTGCEKNEDDTIVVNKSDETFAPSKVRPVLEKQQKAAFTYFYDFAEENSGLAYEGYNHGSKAVTIGGSGFGIMSLIVGAERGWITREQAIERTVKAVRWLGKADRYKGIWSHWHSPDGKAFPFGNQVEAGDAVETSFLITGLIAAQEYFNGGTELEKEISDSVTSFINTIDWNHYTNGENHLYWIWHTPNNTYELPVKGWNEGLITYLLALGAPEGHRISKEAYTAGWQSNGGFCNNNRENYGYKLPLGQENGGPLFFAHYSFVGLNPMRMKDNYAFYWQNNVAHAMINRHYCVYEAPSNYQYSANMWGLTACNGIGSKGYSARCPGNDDGIIAPTAALASYPYVPFYATQVLMSMDQIDVLQGKYGIGDSYEPAIGQANNNHLAIDQGPIVVMIENYRSGLIWDLVMRSEYIQNCLKMAGIELDPVLEEGFAYTTINTETKQYDMMMHPDREQYELDFYAAEAGNATLSISSDNKEVFTTNFECQQGHNRFDFKSNNLLKGRKYTLTVNKNDKTYELPVHLH